LQQIVIDSEPLLRQMWEQRLKDTDLIVLADMRRDDIRHCAVGWWDESVVAKAASEGAYLPYIQPTELIDVLLHSESKVQRAAAKELRGFAGLGMGFVPLFVVSPSGHWATMWSPPESGVGVLRFNPIDATCN
jgi:hypothetical protein